MTGCGFASSFAARASAKRIAYYVRVGRPEDADVSEINVATAGCARARRFVVVLFPHVRSSWEIADLLRALDANDRWACTHVPWRHHERREAALIGVSWRTPDEVWSSVMGFAPLGEMPVTRRAPFVGLALWPGRRDNPYRRGKPGPGVGLVDGAHGMEKDAHDANWKETNAQVVDLFADPAEDREHLRAVAFSIPRAVAQELRFKDNTAPPAQ
jgi:hypothetical protein